MSTRSTIAIQLLNGSFLQAYCHFDGYIKHNGFNLNNYFETQEKALELVRGGNIRTINADEVEYYGEEPSTARTIDEIDEQEYMYVFQNNEWFWKESGEKHYKNLNDSINRLITILEK